MISTPAIMPVPALVALGMAVLALAFAVTLRRGRRAAASEAELLRVVAHGHYCPGCDREWGHPGRTCVQHWSWPCEDCRSGMRAPRSIQQSA